MTPLLAHPPSSRAKLLRMVRQIQGRDFVRLASGRFVLVRVDEKSRPFGEKLGRALAEAGVKT